MNDRHYLIPPSGGLDLVGTKRRFDAALKGERWSMPSCNIAFRATPSSDALLPLCAHCGSTTGVALENSRTAYVKACAADGCHACDGFPGRCFVGHPDHHACSNWPRVDPNAPVPLCRECAERHHKFYDDQWSELRSGQM